MLAIPRWRVRLPSTCCRNFVVSLAFGCPGNIGVHIPVHVLAIADAVVDVHVPASEGWVGNPLAYGSDGLQDPCGQFLGIVGVVGHGGRGGGRLEILPLVLEEGQRLGGKVGGL